MLVAVRWLLIILATHFLERAAPIVLHRFVCHE
jgi:hypothetical protein